MAPCVYGEPRVEDHHNMWDKLRQLKTISNLSWLVLGDFNEAIWQEEHLSCTPRPVNQVDAFCEVLYECNLTDLAFQVCHIRMTIRGLAEQMFEYAGVARPVC
jgi:hypothetical protein